MRCARKVAFGVLVVGVVLVGYFAMHSSGADGQYGRAAAMARAGSQHGSASPAGDHATTTERRSRDDRMPTATMLHVAGLCVALAITIVSVRRRSQARSVLAHHRIARAPAMRSSGRRPAVPPPLALGISRC